jgi:Flp pilus assembly protein TadG
MKGTPGRGERGQSLVEFSLAVTVFLVLVMGVVDLGRAVYQYNGVAQAARELVRATSVHQGSPLGSSADTLDTLRTERGLVPGLITPTYACVDIAGATVTRACEAGDWVRVTVRSTFTPVTPLATMLGQVELSSSASAQLE